MVAEGGVEAPELGAGRRRKDLKEFTLEEVAKHDSIGNRYIIFYIINIAGQTARPTGLKFFVDTHGWPGGVLGQKNSNFFFLQFFNIFAGPFN